MGSNNFRQMNVSSDKEHNRRLSDDDRFVAIEADILCQNAILTKLVHQNDKYTEYLDTEMEVKKENHEFWMDVKKKLTASGIIGTFIVICTAIAYATTQFIKTH